MLRSIIYKEWIKLKWFLILYMLFAVLAIGYTFIKVRHDIAFHEAKSYWYAILFQGFQYFKYLKYVPLLGGLVIGIAQFFPETVNKRIKLTFHLPKDENFMLMWMTSFGALSLLLCFLIMFLILLLLSIYFFPAQIITPAVLSVIPWFLGGFAAYFLASVIILEPVWLFRFLYLIAALALIPLFIEPSVTGGYAHVNLKLGLLVILLGIALLFPGYRFRKGEM